MASSIEYAPIDVDMLDDPKVSALMDDLGGGDASEAFAAYGRLVAVLAHVYRDGWYMRYGKFERRKLAKDVGLTAEELDAFLGSLADCELIDAGMLERGVITSAGIQRRYFGVKRKGRDAMALTEEERGYIIDRDSPRPPAIERDSPRAPAFERDCPPLAANARDLPRTPANERETPHKEKRRKEKRREEEDDARAGARRGSSSSDSNGSGKSLQPYPLACLSTVYDAHGAYFDDAGEAFGTPWDALVSTYANRTRGQPIEGFARQVAAMCPRGCDRSLERVEGCARMLQRALARFDPAKSPNPFPLAKKIIEDERGAS